MGHERLGILPKTRPWKKVIEQISSFSKDEIDISVVARTTLKNLEFKFSNLENDQGVLASFQFLILYSLAGRETQPGNFLSKFGILLTDSPTDTEIFNALNDWVGENIESKEYSTLASVSAITALSEWKQMHTLVQSTLFPDEIIREPWVEASDGAGFCELSRLFFANFIERYLKYFIERAAYASLNSIEEKNNFTKEIEKYVQDISKYAFETSKITQSFAAGWFNKNTKNEIPNDRQIKRFLSKAFSKIKSEIIRERSSI